MSDLHQALNDDELDELSQFLDSEQVPTTTLSLEGLDGLFCALAIVPIPVSLEESLKVAWGDETADPLTGHPQGAYFRGLIERHWQAVVDSFPRFAENPDDGYWPTMFLPDDDTPDNDTSTEYGREWAVGFRIGMEFHPAFWERIVSDEHLAQGLGPVVLLDSGEHPTKANHRIDYATRQELVGSLIPILHSFWMLGRAGDKAVN